MNARRRRRQLRIDRARERVDKLGPTRIIEPQRRPALTAKAPFAARQPACRMFRILDPRAIKAQMLVALDRQRLRVGAEVDRIAPAALLRSEEHTSELQSLMRISYAVFFLKNKH